MFRDAVDPIYRDVITTGGAIICAFLALLGALATVGYRRIGRKVDTAIDLSKPTGNGFARDTLEKLEQLDTIQKSLGALHHRMDIHMQSSETRGERTDRMFISMDDRLTRIEETLE